MTLLAPALAWTLALSGCAAESSSTASHASMSAARPAPGAMPRRSPPPPTTSVAASAPTQPAANDHDQAIRRQAAAELGPEVAATMPEVPASAPVEPVDPGAELIVRSIIDTLAADLARDSTGATTISVQGVRNLSRANAAEFDGFMHRLCGVLSNAGRRDRLIFSDDLTHQAQYRLQGTAYMINAAGFDQWELYLTLTPTDRDYQVWNARNAIRVLRIARPGQPQITFIGK